MFKAIKNAGAFGLGMLAGVCYGSVVGTVTAYVVLMGIA